jgi:hypothetical protein
MPKKVIEKEIKGFSIQIKDEGEYGFIRLTKNGKSIYLHLCPEMDGVYVNTIFKGELRITHLEKDPIGIVLVKFKVQSREEGGPVGSLTTN